MDQQKVAARSSVRLVPRGQGENSWGYAGSTDGHSRNPTPRYQSAREKMVMPAGSIFHNSQLPLRPLVLVPLSQTSESRRFERIPVVLNDLSTLSWPRSRPRRFVCLSAFTIGGAEANVRASFHA